MAPAEHLEALADYLFTFSQEVLEETGGFYPHAAFVNKEGQPELYGVYLGEHPKMEEVYQALLEAFKRDAQAKGYLATGIAVDGRAAHPSGGAKTDAILVFLETRSGDALTVAMQYQKRAGKYEYADTFAIRRNPEVFTS